MWRQRLKESNVARNTLAMTAGGGLRLIFQAAYFILLARSLGSGQYGAFIGVVSLMGVLTPFSFWGMDGILVRNVSRQRESFRVSWGNALWMAGVSGSILLVVVLLLSHFIFSNKVPLLLVFLVGLSDLVLAGIVDLSGKAFMAFEMLGKTARIGIVLTAVRGICALIMYLLVPHPSALSWAVLYLCSTGICAVYACADVCRRYGYPRLALKNIRTDAREGFYFSLSMSSQSIYNNIDKPMLVRLATLESAGIYSTAYRILDLGLQPLSSLLYSTYARFFQHGSSGIKGSSKYAKRLLPFGIGYGILAGLFLFAVAPLLPVILGQSFRGADEALRWLSPLILLRTIHYLLANSLTGADLQGLRSIIQVAVAAFNVGINCWLIPAYSWRGAAWGSLASDGLLAIAMWTSIVILSADSKVARRVDEAQTEGTP